MTRSSTPDWLPMFNRIRKRRKATLADCSACGMDFVHPVAWSPHDEKHWWMLLRCGACGNTRELTVPDAEADLFDHELDRLQTLMRREADRLTRTRFAQETEAFAAALKFDLISAEDFAN